MKTCFDCVAFAMLALFLYGDPTAGATSDSVPVVRRLPPGQIDPLFPDLNDFSEGTGIGDEEALKVPPIPPGVGPTLETATFLLKSQWLFNWSDGMWMNGLRSLIGHDAAGNPNEYLIQHWNGVEWVPEWDEEYTFIYGDKVASHTVFQGPDGQLDYGTRFEFRYRGDEVLDSSRVYWWIANAWQQQYRYSYEYLDGHIVNSYGESLVYGRWQPSSKGYTEYSPSGKVLEARNEYWTGTQWRGSVWSSYTYFPNDMQETRTFREWKNNTWQFTAREAKSYDSSGKQITFTRSSWGNNTWNAYLFDTLFWDNGQMVEFRRHYGNRHEKSTYGYDAFGNWTEQYDWKWTGTTYAPTRKYAKTYMEQPCGCVCHGDPKCDGPTDVVDVVNAIGIAFRNSTAISDHSLTCTRSTTDVNCSGTTDVLDVVKTVNVAFRNADPVTEYCDPCP